MGFEGMGCVHPQQIEIIHRAFAPSAAEIEKALKIAAAFEEAQARGLGVVSVGSKMIDPPVVQRAAEVGGACPADGARASRCPDRSGRNEGDARNRHRHQCAGPPRSDRGQWPRADAVRRHRWQSLRPDARPGRRSAAATTIRRTATSACPTSKPRCASADCAMA